jgi:PIN domain nuclease of toxin-antitoxin system
VKFLLDTCALMWFFTGSDTFSTSVRDDLTDPRNELYFSDVNTLEIVIKNQIGKLPLPKSPSKWLLPLARKHGIDHQPLDIAAIFHLEKLPLLHRDPFDRLLIAQARVHKLTLVTPDPLIHQYDVAYRW